MWAPVGQGATLRYPGSQLGTAVKVLEPLRGTRAGLLAAGKEELDAAGVFVRDCVMVVDVAILRARPDLAAAHSDSLNWILVFHHPGAYVEIVDMLLDIEVTR